MTVLSACICFALPLLMIFDTRSEDNPIAIAENDVVKLNSLSDISEDYRVKVDIKWGTTPDSAQFYESEVRIERFVSQSRELEHYQVSRRSKNFENRPSTLGMQKNCDAIIGRYRQKTFDGFAVNGKVKWYDQKGGTGEVVPNQCEFLREFDLPFVHRNCVISPESPVRFGDLRCYWAESSGKVCTSLWTRADHKGIGYHEVTTEQGVPTRHRIFVTKKGITLKSKPMPRDGTPISDVKTTWRVIDGHQVPIKVEAVLNEANEVVVLEGDLSWEFEKGFPKEIEERFDDLKKLVADK